MSALTDFLLARIIEDEEWAKSIGGDWYPEPYGEGAPAHHARVIAECKTKRRILVRYETEDWIALGGVLKDLALPYADHPDYRDEWRP